MDIDRKKLLSFLYRIGAFWNPMFPNGRNVDASSVLKLRVDQAISTNAIATWQAKDANFSAFTRLIHGREVVPDGEVGPATVAMVELKRCAMPDFAPPPEVKFSYDNPGVQKAVESYQRYAEAGYVGGTGSWPKGCDPQNPNVHSVVVAIDTSASSSSQKSIIDPVLKYVEQTEAEIGQSVRHVRDGSFANPQHNVKFEYISGSVIGYAYFPDPNTCRQTVQARIDNSFNPAIPVLAELLTHEYKGHSDGLEHTNGGIMNPSIGNPTSRASWIGDASYSYKKRYFGGVAIPTTPSDPPPPDPPDDPPPPPPPTPAKITVIGIGKDPLIGSASGTFDITATGATSAKVRVASAGGRNFKLVQTAGDEEPKKPVRRRSKK